MKDLHPDYFYLKIRHPQAGSGHTYQQYIVQEDTIYGVNFDAEIAKAQRAGDYRQAVRLVYLQTLLYLQNASLIDWQPSKTPVQYMRQVNSPAFTAMSHHFIRVRFNILSDLCF